MEFLGIGYQELLLVLVLMLVFVGPERLPNMAYQIGRAVRTLQQYARQVRDEFGEEIDYLEEQVRTVKGEVDSAAAEFRQQSNRFNAELREATAPLNEAASELRRPIDGLSTTPPPTAPPEAALVSGNGLTTNGVSVNGAAIVAGAAAGKTEPVPPAAEMPPEASKGENPPLVF
ncbi:MAG: Sec-independent protein translocase protein TatB [Dehalococcoidia bacterium]|nr:Sec-independent protein translocase protein TatB [Dehalococcoidia bacterium]